MHPASGDEPQRPGGWYIVSQIDLDIMIAGHALILATPECVKVFAIEIAHDGGDIAAIIIDSAGYLMESADRGDGKFCRWDHKAFIHKNICSSRMVYHHEREVIVIVGLPQFCGETEIIKTIVGSQLV